MPGTGRGTEQGAGNPAKILLNSADKTEEARRENWEIGASSGGRKKGTLYKEKPHTRKV